jgi:hypothetical protein
MKAMVVVSSPIGFHIFLARHASFGSEAEPSEASILECLQEEHFFLFQNSSHAAGILTDLEHKCTFGLSRQTSFQQRFGPSSATY